MCLRSSLFTKMTCIDATVNLSDEDGAAISGRLKITLGLDLESKATFLTDAAAAIPSSERPAGIANAVSSLGQVLQAAVRLVDGIADTMVGFSLPGSEVRSHNYPHGVGFARHIPFSRYPALFCYVFTR